MSTPAAPSAPAPKAAPAANPASSISAPSNEGGKVSGTPAPAAAAPPRMLKVKFDGKEVEMPESEVLALASAGKVSTQRFQEAAAMRKQAEDLLKFAKANPKEFFQKTGMNAREWAENYLIEELNNEAMSPEQRKARENEEKLRKYENDEKSRTEKQKQLELERTTNTERERLDLVFTKALNESGLPRTKFTVKRMAELQLINIKNKFELNPSQLAKLVREDYAAEQKSLLTSLDGDQLIDFLGPENAKKFSKAQIAKLKARGVGTGPSGQKKTVSQQNDTGLTWRELQKRNRKPL